VREGQRRERVRLLRRHRAALQGQGAHRFGRQRAPEQVTLPAELVQDMLNMVTEVAKSDGDVRGLVEIAQRVMQEAHDQLLIPVLGLNTYWIEPSDQQ
jgi:hypothetical protein